MAQPIMVACRLSLMLPHKQESLGQAMVAFAKPFSVGVWILCLCAVLWTSVARRDSAEDFSRLNALLFTAVAWIFIPVYCFAIPRT